MLEFGVVGGGQANEQQRSVFERFELLLSMLIVDLVCFVVCFVYVIWLFITNSC